MKKPELTMNFRGMVPQRVLVLSNLSDLERKQYQYITRLLRKEFRLGPNNFLPRGVTRKILTLLRIVK